MKQLVSTLVILAAFTSSAWALGSKESLIERGTAHEVARECTGTDIDHEREVERP